MRLHSLKKSVRTLTACLLSAVVLVCSACARNPSSNPDVGQASTIDEAATAPVTAPESVDLSEINFALEKNAYESFRAWLDKAVVYYEGEEHFEIEDALSQYNEMRRVENGGDKLINNNKLDENIFFDKLLQNNNSYFEDNNTSAELRADENTVKKLTKIMAASVNNLLDKHSQININALNYNLNNLVVAGDDEVAVCELDAYSPIVRININLLNGANGIEPEKAAFESVVKYISVCLAQTGYPINGEFLKNRGCCFAFKESKVHSLYWDWYVDASAERISMDSFSAEPSVFPEQVDMLDFITFALSADVSYTEGALEDCSLSRNIDDVFACLNQETDEEKKEAVKLMLSLNAVYGNEPELDELYTADKDSSVQNSPEEFHQSLLNSAYKSVTKLFFMSLAKGSVDTYTRLGDVFDKISELKKELESRAGDFYENPDLWDYYDAVSQAYFRCIAPETGESESELLR